MSAAGRHAMAAPASAGMKKNDIGFVSGKIFSSFRNRSYRSYSWPSCGSPGLRPFRLSGEFQLAARGVEIDENGLAVADFAFQDAASERRLDLALDRAFERARAVERVIAPAHQMRARRVGQFQADVTFGQALPQPVELYLHDLFQVLF